jgi:endonuclease/exonuclease/phosphatase (EEP) superfamily protein YafD
MLTWDKTALQTSVRLLVTSIAIALSSGCAVFSPANERTTTAPLANHGHAIASEIAVCHTILGRSQTIATPALDGNGIELLNWNIRKASHDDLLTDLERFATDKDLVLIQEAAIREGMLESLNTDHFWSFAPGYRSGDIDTGVMTVSRSAPLAQCNLTSYEPWLGTPKATSVTLFALSGTEKTLLVINIHAVNLTLDRRAIQQQLDPIIEIVNAHDGPIIFAGDFNTWHPYRIKVLQETTKALELTALEFSEDHRTTTFGHQLDHIYIRGLQVEYATSSIAPSSDHNPMSIRLRL